jgi:hypothetical protein
LNRPKWQLQEKAAIADYGNQKDRNFGSVVLRALPGVWVRQGDFRKLLANQTKAVKGKG